MLAFGAAKAVSAAPGFVVCKSGFPAALARSFIETNSHHGLTASGPLVLGS